MNEGSAEQKCVMIIAGYEGDEIISGHGEHFA